MPIAAATRQYIDEPSASLGHNGTNLGEAWPVIDSHYLKGVLDSSLTVLFGRESLALPFVRRKTVTPLACVI